jgi:hypothetical protein
VWRWALRGYKGHKLESFSIGGKKYTTDQAYERFIAALNGEPARHVTPRQRESQRLRNEPRR